MREPSFIKEKDVWRLCALSMFIIRGAECWEIWPCRIFMKYFILQCLFICVLWSQTFRISSTYFMVSIYQLSFLANNWKNHTHRRWHWGLFILNNQAIHYFMVQKICMQDTIIFFLNVPPFFFWLTFTTAFRLCLKYASPWKQGQVTNWFYSGWQWSILWEVLQV